MRGKGNGGTYFYFLCRGRQDHQCDRPYLRVEKLEQAVTRHYATVTISEGYSSRIRAMIEDAALDELGNLSALKKRLTTRLRELDTKEDQYLDLVGEPGWPKAKLQRKLDGIQAERDQIQAQLDDTGSRLEVGREFLLTALALLRNPQEAYDRAGTSLKRAMNKLIFTRLYVDADDITGHELSQSVRDLVQAHAAHRTRVPAASDTSSPAREDEAAWSKLTGADLLDLALAGQGSSKTALVGAAGLEPATAPVHRDPPDGQGLSQHSCCLGCPRLSTPVEGI
ncbi:MAG TPA: hypothetical protein VGX25_24470 [Actinophytocola sp.]|uniref:recombinase zinc beta ribbon domain-containing protein n=1 Tax=Actinophytocola sp. TaxID=1872138 RepID=UPI002DDDA936|nr:hypothetical protein [Actinophytocola sp.]HEV2782561.1 hypothetical protein [Actinophytocola sp.]